MLRCSSDFLYTATISNCPGKLFEADMDSYVLSKLQSILCDFFNILQTKQKFQILCQEPKFSSICNWIIQYMITPFYQSILNDRINIENRCEYMKTLTALLNLGLFLNHQFPALYATSPFSFDPSPLTTLLVNPMEDSHLRDAGLTLLYSIHLIFPTQTLLAVANTVRDRTVFTWIWTTDLFNQPSVLIALKMRIKLLAARDQHMFIEILHSIHDALPNIYKNMTEQCITQLLSIISLCELKNNIDSNTVNEYTTTYVSLFQLLVSYYCSCEIIFDYLSSNTSISMQTYTSILSQSIDLYSNSVLYQYILPYIANNLSHFKKDGVSGDENEQALIDFIHDIAISYISRDNKYRDILVSQILFMNCINSMRHGYIETERFPEICAKLLRSEFNSSFPTTDQQSLSWLKLVFVENHFDTLRTRRALKDMITLCIYNHLGGISGQETINDANTMDNSQIDFSDPFIQQLFNTLTSIQHGDVYLIWSDLLLENKYMLNASNSTLPSMIIYEKQLLININNYIKSIELQENELLSTYQSILTLCHTLSSVVSPCLTFLLFEVILRTTYAANRYLKEPILCDDDVLTFLLSRFPRTESNINPEEIYYTSNDVIDICISICNEQTRQQLAYLFPTRFLLDPSTIVRKTALACVSNYPQIVMQNAKLVYDGIMMGIQEDDKHIGLGELDLIFASCTPIYHLCLMKPKEYTPSLLALLCKGIKLSKENDTQNKPSTMLLTCLNDIAINMNHKDIVSIMNELPANLLKTVCDYSPKWDSLINQAESDGMVLNSIDEEYQTSLKLIHTYEQQKLYMDAIRLCVSIKNRVPDESRKQTLSNLLTTLLVNLSAAQLPQQDSLGNYVLSNPVNADMVNNWIVIVMELQTICPMESESAIQISKLYYYLVNLYNSLTVTAITTTDNSAAEIAPVVTATPQYVTGLPYDDQIIQSSLFQKCIYFFTVSPIP